MSRGSNPARTQDRGDIEEQDVPEAHLLAQLLDDAGLTRAGLAHSVDLQDLNSGHSSIIDKGPCSAGTSRSETIPPDRISFSRVEIHRTVDTQNPVLRAL